MAHKSPNDFTFWGEPVVYLNGIAMKMPRWNKQNANIDPDTTGMYQCYIPGFLAARTATNVVINLPMGSSQISCALTLLLYQLLGSAD